MSFFEIKKKVQCMAGTECYFSSRNFIIGMRARGYKDSIAKSGTKLLK